MNLHVFSSKNTISIDNINFTRGRFCIHTRSYEFIAEDAGSITIGQLLEIEKQYNVKIEFYRKPNTLIIDFTN